MKHASRTSLALQCPLTSPSSALSTSSTLSAAHDVLAGSTAAGRALSPAGSSLHRCATDLRVVFLINTQTRAPPSEGRPPAHTLISLFHVPGRGTSGRWAHEWAGQHLQGHEGEPWSSSVRGHDDSIKMSITREQTNIKPGCVPRQREAFIAPPPPPPPPPPRCYCSSHAPSDP